MLGGLERSVMDRVTLHCCNYKDMAARIAAGRLTEV
jgi:hypothetical protein